MFYVLRNAADARRREFIDRHHWAIIQAQLYRTLQPTPGWRAGVVVWVEEAQRLRRLMAES